MAQTLIEDQQYSLLTSEERSNQRLVYYVKLTDSCLKAIEEHISFKAATTRAQPRIKFDSSIGTLNIPSSTGSAFKDVGKKFNFSIAPLHSNQSTPLQGILECIKHADRTTDILTSFGALESRINIATTEDVYENTRNRMAQVDKERKDVRTKEIKISSGTKQGKKAKAKMVHQLENKIGSMKKKLVPHSNHHSSTSSPKPSTAVFVQNPSSSVTSTYSPHSQHNPPLAAGKNFSCRERVLHVLAIRPHKKPELYKRLQREAMSQKDRNNLKMILQQVSTLTENQYKMHGHLYSEVDVDAWPFYSESEMLTVKKNIVSYKKKTDTSPQIVTSTSKSPDDKTASKRPIPTNEHTASDITSKKNRLDESNKAEEPSSTSQIITTTCSSKEDIVESLMGSTKTVKEIDKQPKHNKAESSPTVASTSDTPEYLENYKPITSYEIRCQYKRDFQAEYPEYIELKKNVDAVTTKFMELDRSWKRAEKGSKEYYKIQDEIVDAYNKQQKDEKFHEMKRRCQELHEKLFHIKRLVVEYDNAHISNT